MISTPIFETDAQRTAWIEANAAYFTAIRHLGRGNRSRAEFPSRAEAEASAPGDGRTMIYAVAPDGRSAHLVNR